MESVERSQDVRQDISDSGNSADNAPRLERSQRDVEPPEHPPDECHSMHEHDDSVSSFSINSWGSFNHLLSNEHNDIDVNDVPDNHNHADTGNDFEYEDSVPDSADAPFDGHGDGEGGEGDIIGLPGGETADDEDDMHSAHQNGDRHHDPGRWNREADGAAGPPPEFRNFWGTDSDTYSSPAGDDNADDEPGAAPVAAGTGTVSVSGAGPGAGSSSHVEPMVNQHFHYHQTFHDHHHHYHRHNHYKSKTVQKFHSYINKEPGSIASKQQNDWGKRLHNARALQSHEPASDGVIDVSDVESEQTEGYDHLESESDYDPDPVIEPPCKSHRTMS
eukprot:s3428_g8.t1